MPSNSHCCELLSNPLLLPSFRKKCQHRRHRSGGESNFPSPSADLEKSAAAIPFFSLIHLSFPDHLNTDSICLPLQPLWLTSVRFPPSAGGEASERRNPSKVMRKGFHFPSGSWQGRAGQGRGAVRVMAGPTEGETERNHPPSKIGPLTIESLRTNNAHTYSMDRADIRGVREERYVLRQKARW